MTWRREDVELGMRFDRDGVVYKVVALIDEPVVVVVPADERDGDDLEHHVIASPIFAEFRRVQLEDHTGAVQFGGFDS